ncbi:hypothetical protein [Rathayibacter sp. VKM Ac-2630]|uniref:hypothetical protein n=1 Tax=Rathayibacter sp. VKM Ac-2630 TaxID=1938617 RepID=UPI00156D6BEB|nr:hypothetical protein [Rathayibacter sp. VKM Ac-2630]
MLVASLVMVAAMIDGALVGVVVPVVWSVAVVISGVWSVAGSRSGVQSNTGPGSHRGLAAITMVALLIGHFEGGAHCHGSLAVGPVLAALGVVVVGGIVLTTSAFVRHADRGNAWLPSNRGRWHWPCGRCPGIVDELRKKMVRLHRTPPPVYSPVSEAKQHDWKRGGGALSNVTIVPIAQRIDKKKLVRAILALVRWQMENPDYVRDDSKAAVVSTPILEPAQGASPSSSSDRRRRAHQAGSTTNPASSSTPHPPAGSPSVQPDAPERAAA